MPDPEPKDSLAFLLAEILKELRRTNDTRAAERTREILDIKDAAAYLGLSEHTVRMYVRKREIPCFKVGGAIRFRRSRLNQWIDQGEIRMIS